MGVQQHLSNRNHHTVLFLTLMVSLILISACGAAEVSDGESNYVVPTDPPSGAGPIPTAEEGGQGYTVFFEQVTSGSGTTYKVVPPPGVSDVAT